MADARPNASSSEFVRANETMLRTKYLDYCSAQVAEHLLSLSPDEIYLLAEATHRRDGAPGDGAPSYDRMVQMATEGIIRRLELPEAPSRRSIYRHLRERSQEQTPSEVEGRFAT